MPVDIKMPTRRIGDNGDPLEKLANAVSIAKSVYGIYADSKTLDQALADKAKSKEVQDLQLKKLQREESQASEDDNPNSPLMKSIREAARLRGITLPEGITPRQARTNFDAFLKPKDAKAADPYAEEMKRLRLEEMKNKQTQVSKNNREFQDRYQNILTQVEKAKQMVSDKGTFEATGPHNEMLQQSIDSIAIDAAKLFDPQSVARESEVKAFRDMLFEGGTLTKSNATAMKLLDNFKNIVQSRAENLAKLNGMGSGPAQMSAEDQQALQWAQSNPNDPRAIKILQMHGMDKGVAKK